jgi:hypothetical protein
MHSIVLFSPASRLLGKTVSSRRDSNVFHDSLRQKIMTPFIIDPWSLSSACPTTSVSDTTSKPLVGAQHWHPRLFQNFLNARLVIDGSERFSFARFVVQELCSIDNPAIHYESTTMPRDDQQPASSAPVTVKCPCP